MLLFMIDRIKRHLSYGWNVISHLDTAFSILGKLGIGASAIFAWLYSWFGGLHWALALIVGLLVIAIGMFILVCWKAFYVGKNKRIPLIELRQVAENNGWNFGGDSLHALELAHGLTQAGLDGDIRFWGRPDIHMFESLNRQELLTPIDQEHWRNGFKVEPIGLMQAGENFHVKTYLPGSDTKGFLDIHVMQKEAIEWLISKATEEYRDTDPKRWQ